MKGGLLNGPANCEQLAGHVLVVVVAKLFFFVALFVIVDRFNVVLQTTYVTSLCICSQAGVICPAGVYRRKLL